MMWLEYVQASEDCCFLGRELFVSRCDFYDRFVHGGDWLLLRCLLEVRRTSDVLLFFFSSFQASSIMFCKRLEKNAINVHSPQCIPQEAVNSKSIERMTITRRGG